MKEKISQFLADHANSVGIHSAIDSETSLIESGVIDSVAMVDLIAFLEKQYGIQVTEDDMVPENFDSIDAIVSFVQSKQ